MSWNNPPYRKLSNLTSPSHESSQQQIASKKTKIPSRERIHIPPNGKRKIIDSKVLAGTGYLIVLRRVDTKSHNL